MVAFLQPVPLILSSFSNGVICISGSFDLQREREKERWLSSSTSQAYRQFESIVLIVCVIVAINQGCLRESCCAHCPRRKWRRYLVPLAPRIVLHFRAFVSEEIIKARLCLASINVNFVATNGHRQWCLAETSSRRKMESPRWLFARYPRSSDETPPRALKWKVARCEIRFVFSAEKRRKTRRRKFSKQVDGR